MLTHMRQTNQDQQKKKKKKKKKNRGGHNDRTVLRTILRDMRIKGSTSQIFAPLLPTEIKRGNICRNFLAAKLPVPKQLTINSHSAID